MTFRDMLTRVDEALSEELHTLERATLARKRKAKKAKPAAARKSRKGIHHRNTSATQKHLLHRVDVHPGRSVAFLAKECEALSVRGEVGITRSIGRLVARGFLRVSKAGLLYLAQSLYALPPAVTRYSSRPPAALAREYVQGVRVPTSTYLASDMAL